MAVGWSADAKAAIQAGCPVEFSAHVDVEKDGTGSYGLNIVDITTYVIEPWPRIKRSSSVIACAWETGPIVLKVNNSSGYFTPNLCSSAKTLISNVWQRRPAGEAAYRECKIYIKEKITLPDKSTEELTRFQGMIIDINPIIDESRMIMEIIIRDQLLDALDRIFEMGDGGSSYMDVPL